MISTKIVNSQMQRLLKMIQKQAMKQRKLE
jgi:hypothetical protein